MGWRRVWWLCGREWVALIVAGLWAAFSFGPLEAAAPSAKYVIPALALASGLAAEASLLSGRTLGRIGLLSVLAAVFQVAVWHGRGVYLPLASYGWLDDHSYWKESLIIRDYWMRGEYPDLSRAGGAPHLGTLHTAWHRILAAAAWLGAESPGGLRLVNLWFSCMLPLVVFLAGRRLGRQILGSSGGRAGFACAALVALYPSGVYYGSFLLKDYATGFAAMVALWAGLRVIEGRRGAWLLLACSLFYLVPLRAYAGLAVLAAVAVSGLARLSLGAFVQGVLGCVVGVYLLLFHPRFGAVLEQLATSLAGLMPSGAVDHRVFLAHIGAGTFRAFLAPYPWVVAEGNFPNYEVYFGQWYLFLIGYPLAAAALWQAVRHDRVRGVAPFVMAACGVGVLILGFGGNITRQRFFADLWVLTAAGCGAQTPQAVRRWAFGLVGGGIALFAVAQLTRLFLASGSG